MDLDTLIGRIGLPVSRRDQAAQWHVRLRSDLVSEAELQVFELWVANPSNRRAYDAIEHLSAEIDDRRWEIKAALDRPAHSRLQISRHPAEGRTLLSRLAIASVALAIVAGTVIGLIGDHHTAWTPYTTALGERRNISLSDGSEIALNVNSAIRVALNGDVRRVQLSDAEASFHVAKDRKRPFVISVGSQEIRVVGTQFNVLHHLDRTVISVREGVVEVRTMGPGGSEPSHRLGRGDQLVHRNGAADTLVHMPDPEAAFAWQTGHLVYSGARLEDVVADLNRYFTVPIRTEGSRTASLKFSGILSIDSEAAVVRRLEKFLPLEVAYSPGAYILRSRPAP